MFVRKSQIKRKAIALLAIQEQARRGLAKKLCLRFFAPGDAELVEAVLDELENQKYLSDERYAIARLHTRSLRYGDRRLREELRHKGLDSELIDNAMGTIEKSELERARAVWTRKFGASPQDRKEHARQVRFLASRGFSFSVIEQVIKNCDESTNSEDWTNYE